MTLHRAWCASGYDPDAFWRQSPRSFASAMGGARDRMRREGERDLVLAHLGVVFHRTKMLHPVEHYLRRQPAARGRVNLLERVRAIAARTGGSS